MHGFRGGPCPAGLPPPSSLSRSLPPPCPPRPRTAGWGPSGSPGAAGLGDPYFPLDGNGGYDVAPLRPRPALRPGDRHAARRRHDPGTATQDLSRFNLDLVGLTVRAHRGRRAAGELEPRRRRADDHPAHGAAQRHARSSSTVALRRRAAARSARPRSATDGFIHTDDGALVAGEPHVAATWFPVNDHPLDKATYTFRVTVPGRAPGGRQRRPAGHDARSGGWTTWTWDATEPMASYLATVDDRRSSTSHAYRDGRHPLLGRHRPRPVRRRRRQPRTRHAVRDLAGRRRRVQAPDAHDRRPGRRRRSCRSGCTATPSRTGTSSSSRRTRSAPDDWTTLPDANGHTSAGHRARRARLWLGLPPVPRALPDRQRRRHLLPTGTTGDVVGGDRAERRLGAVAVDLSRYAGKQVEVSLAYASDDVVQLRRRRRSTTSSSRAAQGSTSFEDDGDTLDGWTVPGAPAGSPGNANDWIVGTVADTPPAVGERRAARRSRASRRSSHFLAELLRAVPVRATRAASSTTSRARLRARDADAADLRARTSSPTAADGDTSSSTSSPTSGSATALAVARWQRHLAQRGLRDLRRVAVERARGRTGRRRRSSTLLRRDPADDDFWTSRSAIPGRTVCSTAPVYDRGAMTLHALRLAVGDDAFFRHPAPWGASNAGGNVTTAAVHRARRADLRPGPRRVLRPGCSRPRGRPAAGR